jgi:protein-S-isoprenylcysteine O-methyltransferase Ste14
MSEENATHEEVKVEEKKESPVGVRFKVSFAWTFVVFMLLIVATQHSSQWLAGAIGAGIFALAAGVISMAIKTEQKVIYVPISLLIVFVIAAAIGMSQLPAQ